MRQAGQHGPQARQYGLPQDWKQRRPCPTHLAGRPAAAGQSQYCWESASDQRALRTRASEPGDCRVAASKTRIRCDPGSGTDARRNGPAGRHCTLKKVLSRTESACRVAGFAPRFSPWQAPSAWVYARPCRARSSRHGPFLAQPLRTSYSADTVQPWIDIVPHSTPVVKPAGHSNRQGPISWNDCEIHHSCKNRSLGQTGLYPCMS